ncbi:MAG: HDOD domain-containing protein [Pseudomonadota bacterium]
MNPVHIASANEKEAQDLGKILGEHFTVTFSLPSNRFGGLKGPSDILLFDQSFVEQLGLENVKKLLNGIHKPVVLLTSPTDIRMPIEATKLGLPFLVKQAGYHEVLRYTIEETLRDYRERAQLKRAVVALKYRVEELEQSASRPDAGSSQGDQREQITANILDHIVFVFKRGEINLPALPQLSIKFQNLVNKGSNLQEIGELLKQDIAISSKLISVSNSPFYRGISESTTMGQAIGRLGLKNTKRYVDAICNRGLYAAGNKKFVETMEKLWEHSLACAYPSQVLGLDLDNDAFTMGLLHDIGRLLLLQIIGELQKSKKLGENLAPSEFEETLVSYHGKFGAALLKKWKFSDSFSQVASFHDNLENADAPSNDLMVVNLGNLIVKSMGYDNGSPEEIDLGNALSFRHLGLDITMMDEIKSRIEAYVEEMKGLL